MEGMLYIYFDKGQLFPALAGSMQGGVGWILFFPFVFLHVRLLSVTIESGAESNVHSLCAFSIGLLSVERSLMFSK